MSVIGGPGPLPDVRDGLKPVPRCLYAMNDMGNDYTSLQKSARVVGDVIGTYHPT